MLSTHEEEVLRFIHEFEESAREYLKAKGMSEHEAANAYLELQWDFLHTILKKTSKKSQRSARRLNHPALARSNTATIA